MQAVTPAAPRRRLNPAKLLLSKWTAVIPRNKERHFLVTKLVLPELSATRTEFVELEAVISRRVLTLPWRELTDTLAWHQGWK